MSVDLAMADQGIGVVERHAFIEGLESDGPVHGPGVEVGNLHGRRQLACGGGFPRTGRSVDGDDHMGVLSLE